MGQLETKPIVEMKTGVWVNREKMKKVIYLITLMYGLITLFYSVSLFLNGLYSAGIIVFIVGIPCWLIQLSYQKYKKGEKEI